MATRMQQRRDTAAQWTSTNPVLAAGEWGVESDTGKAKLGNGSAAWASLSYVAVPNAAAAADITAAIDALKGGASAAWDTLVEIQNAVTSDEGVAAALAASVSSLSATVAAAVSDTAYDATSWDGDTTHAPSKNAVRDKIESIGGFVSFAAGALNPDLLIVGAITRDANDAVTSAAVVWPDGTVGTFTADTLSASFLGAVDAYHITYGSPATRTYTQPLVTRNSHGAITTRPALVVT